MPLDRQIKNQSDEFEIFSSLWPLKFAIHRANIRSLLLFLFWALLAILKLLQENHMKIPYCSIVIVYTDRHISKNIKHHQTFLPHLGSSSSPWRQSFFPLQTIEYAIHLVVFEHWNVPWWHTKSPVSKRWNRSIYKREIIFIHFINDGNIDQCYVKSLLIQYISIEMNNF